jgi:dihydropyrimidine dehydrogenase (NAD+) subunit PreA
MDEKGYATIEDFRGKSLAAITDFGNLNLLARTVAQIEETRCIQCNLCYIACEDTAHQCIDRVAVNGKEQPRVRQDDCVGCALCFLVCPVDNCITMVRKDDGTEAVTWNQLMQQLPQPLTWESLRQFQKKHGIDIH